MGLRYKDLCRMQTQVSTKSAEYEETYVIALDGYNKILEDVDEFIRQKEANKFFGSTNLHDKSLPAGITINKGENNIKGVKLKEKLHGKSTRPKGALEKARKKKKTVQSPQEVPSNDTNNQSNDKISFPEQNLSNTLFNMPSIPSNFNQIQSIHGDQNSQTSMVELMQQVHSWPLNHRQFGDYSK
ncbi:hypothetical protein CsatB_003006 [Cannabis sativa]